MSEPLRELPIFPLSTVLFPGGLLPLRIFEQRYLEMIKVCLRDNVEFGVCLIDRGTEVGSALPFNVGCTAAVVSWDMPHLGMFQLMTQGRAAFRIVEQWTQPDGLLRARVASEPEPLPPTLPSEFQPLCGLLETLMERLGPEHFPTPHRLTDASWVSYRLSEVVAVNNLEKQALLELRDPIVRLERLQALLALEE